MFLDDVQLWTAVLMHHTTSKCSIWPSQAKVLNDVSGVEYELVATRRQQDQGMLVSVRRTGGILQSCATKES